MCSKLFAQGIVAKPACQHETATSRLSRVHKMTRAPGRTEAISPSNWMFSGILSTTLDDDDARESSR